jgi:hypothetical protein
MTFGKVSALHRARIFITLLIDSQNTDYSPPAHVNLVHPHAIICVISAIWGYMW